MSKVKNSNQMRIAFLDIDGVIATHNALDKAYKDYYCVDTMEEAWEIHQSKEYPFLSVSMYHWPFCENAMKNIYRLQKETKCRFVMCSSWRTGKTIEEINELMWMKGFRITFIDKTKHGESRGSEIKEWLSRHKDVERYVIIDDECYYDILPIHPNNCVQTDFEVGFTESDLNKAIAIMLNSTPNPEVSDTTEADSSTTSDKLNKH